MSGEVHSGNGIAVSVKEREEVSTISFQYQEKPRILAGDRKRKSKEKQNHSVEPEEKEQKSERETQVDDSKPGEIDDSSKNQLLSEVEISNIAPGSPSGDVTDALMLNNKSYSSLDSMKYDLLSAASVEKQSTSESQESSQVSFASVSPGTHNELLCLKAKYSHLQNQVSEMVSFLADYGLVWVGERQDEKSALASSPTRSPGHLDFEKFFSCIEDLNQLAGYGEPQVVYTNDGATFKNPESIPLVLYANGLMLSSGPFRAFKDAGTQLFVRDILDGFFPSELQYAYPDGVSFQVTDKHNINYEDGRTWKPFECRGYRLGRKESKSNKEQVDADHTRSNLVGTGKNVATSGATNKQLKEQESLQEETEIPEPAETSTPSEDQEQKTAVSVLPNTDFIPTLPATNSEPRCVGSKRMLHPEKLKDVPHVSKRRSQDLQSVNVGTKGQSKSCFCSFKKGLPDCFIQFDTNLKRSLGQSKCSCSAEKNSKPDGRKKLPLRSSNVDNKQDKNSPTFSSTVVSEKKRISGKDKPQTDRGQYVAEKSDIPVSLKKQSDIPSGEKHFNDKKQTKSQKPTSNVTPSDSQDKVVHYTPALEKKNIPVRDKSQMNGDQDIGEKSDVSIKPKEMSDISSGEMHSDDKKQNKDQKSNGTPIKGSMLYESPRNFVSSPVCSVTRLRQSREESVVNSRNPNETPENAIRDSETKKSKANNISSDDEDVPVNYNLKLQASTNSLTLKKYASLLEDESIIQVVSDEPQRSEDFSPDKQSVDNSESSAGLEEEIYFEGSVESILLRRYSSVDGNVESHTAVLSSEETLSGVEDLVAQSLVKRLGKVSISLKPFVTRSVPPTTQVQRKSILSKPVREAEHKYETPVGNVKDGLQFKEEMEDGPQVQPEVDLGVRHARFLKKLASDDFLKKLPSTVARDGYVVDIREGIAEIFQETAPIIKTINYDSLTNLSDAVILKVRSEDGRIVYLVRMSPDETVGALYNLLTKARDSDVGEVTSGYLIMSGCMSMEQMPLLDKTLTLRECGLLYNTVLHLKSI